MIACCGLSCSTCPIHLATLEQDESRRLSMRLAIAKICSEQYGTNLSANDISDCDGCMSNTGRLFNSCRKCEIRNCALERNLQSCAFCDDYACDRLQKLFKSEPNTKLRLDGLRQKFKA